MNVTPLRVLLFVVAAIVAATGTAYVTGALDPYVGRTSSEIASLPDGKASSKDDRVSGEAAKDDADESAGPSAGDDGKKPAAVGEDAAVSTDAATGEDADTGKEAGADAADDTADGVVVPGFTVVRVEPDGSLVIAGTAGPDAQVEVVDGATVIGETRAGPGGDFAIVLDEPLQPGDYQLVLRATSPDGVAATSKETAVVSVPDGADGQVLALVEQPGEPSRLITVPEGDTGGAENAAASDDGDAPDSAAGKGERQSAMAESNGSGASGTEERTRARNGEQPASATETADQGTDRANDEQTDADRQIAPGKDDSSGFGSNESGDERQAGEGKADKASASRISEASPDATLGDAGANTGDEAAQSDASRAGSAADDNASQPNVFIEAVEIDGDTVYVAGMSEPGRRVRVYANEILLGDAQVSPGGRFLVEARRDLPVGDYIVRADLLSKNGGEVVARAAVPFERPEGDKVAAVAPGAGANGGSAGKDKGPENGTGGDVADKGAGSAGRSGADVSSASADDASSGTQTARPASAKSRAAGDDTQDDTTVAMRDDDGEGNAQPGTGSEASNERPASKADEDSDRVAAAADGDAGGTGDGNEDEAMAGADGVTAPKLEPVDHAVIIRRGDTLWQISRRVYGRGIRYTNIYLANQKQIRDPHWIWPGQVFAVPDTTSEGVAADMQAIGDQAVPLPGRAEADTTEATRAQ